MAIVHSKVMVKPYAIVPGLPSKVDFAKNSVLPNVGHSFVTIMAIVFLPILLSMPKGCIVFVTMDGQVNGVIGMNNGLLLLYHQSMTLQL